MTQIALLSLQLAGIDGTIEELNEAELAGRLSCRVAQGKGASIAAREKSMHVRPNERVDRPAGHLQHLLLRFKHVELEIGLLVLVKQKLVVVDSVRVVGVAIRARRLHH